MSAFEYVKLSRSVQISSWYDFYGCVMCVCGYMILFKSLNVLKVKLYWVVWFILASVCASPQWNDVLCAAERVAEFKVPCAVSHLWSKAACKVCLRGPRERNTTSIYSRNKKACLLLYTVSCCLCSSIWNSVLIQDITVGIMIWFDLFVCFCTGSNLKVRNCSLTIKVLDSHISVKLMNFEQLIQNVLNNHMIWVVKAACLTSLMENRFIVFFNFVILLTLLFFVSQFLELDRKNTVK